MRRRKLRVKKVALVLIFIIFIAACIFIFKGVNGTNGSLFSQSKTGYLASSTSKVSLYE